MFETRAGDREIMDNLSLDGNELERTLASLENVNRLLGGNHALVAGVATALKGEGFSGNDRPITIFDLGCGGGDGLRALARWGQSRSTKFRLKGIDANPFVVDYARRRSAGVPDLSFEAQDLFDVNLRTEGVDIVTFSLCLHHFEDKEIRGLLRRCQEEQVRAVVINDLHRHWFAYHSFRIFAYVMRYPRMAREDGLLSIRKGFRREELLDLLSDLSVQSFQVRWCWAFRYRVVIAF